MLLQFHRRASNLVRLLSHRFRFPQARALSRKYPDNRQGNYEDYDYYEDEWDQQSQWIYERRRYFYRAGLIGGGAGLYYYTHLEETPITGRKRFMQVSGEQEKWMAKVSLEEIMQQYGGAILPSYHPVTRYVNKVAQRIIDAIDPALVQPGTKWRIFVVDAPIANAFVLPGGEIFVFTGILPVARNEDGLAAVIGHEIAHKIARHVAEKVSFYQFTTIAMAIFQMIVLGDVHIPFSGLVKDLLVFLPFSRKCEVEADYIGMLLMAQACFDPAEASQVWRRMETLAQGPQPPAFLSTHPGHRERIEKINGWLPEARKRFEDAGCLEGGSAGLLDGFFGRK